MGSTKRKRVKKHGYNKTVSNPCKKRCNSNLHIYECKSACSKNKTADQEYDLGENKNSFSTEYFNLNNADTLTVLSGIKIDWRMEEVDRNLYKTTSSWDQKIRLLLQEIKERIPYNFQLQALSIISQFTEQKNVDFRILSRRKHLCDFIRKDGKHAILNKSNM